jgi:ABC-type polysaccharide/polyol phosphate export permease
MAKVDTVRLQLPLLTMLGLIFITLKLMGYISWSWWLVLLPIWVPMMIMFSVLIGIFLFTFNNEKKTNGKK